MVFRFIIILIFLAACNNQKTISPETKALNSYLAANGITLEEKNALLFIPKVGCGECVKSAWELFKKRYYANITFVTDNQFTEQSKNPKKNRLIIENENSKKKLEDLFFMDIYPLLILMNENKEIIHIDKLSPGNEEVFLNSFEKTVNN
jgi:hypothetical protein